MNPDELDVLREELEGLLEGMPDMPDFDALGIPMPTTVEEMEEVIDVVQEVIKRSPTVSVYNDAKLDRDYERLMRMTQVFGKFASMLALRNIKVDVTTDHNAPDAPAWSDSESITFRRDKIRSLDKPETITSLKGLSLHEIAHILLTPRDGTVIVKKVRADKLWQAFNALEDMRIEMFMTARYSNVKDWLTATIAQYLLDNDKQVKYQFPLVYGRKYLPVEVRKLVRDQYVQPQHVAELEQLIDKYIVLNLSDPANYNTAYDIIKRYNEIVNEMSVDHPNYGGENAGMPCSDNECGNHHTDGWTVTRNPNGHDTRKNAEWKPVKGKALNKQQQDAIAKKIKIDNGHGYGPVSDGASDVDGQPSDTPSNSPGAGGDKSYRSVLEDVVQDIQQRRREEIVDAIRQLNGEAKLNSKHVAPPKRNQWTQQIPVDAQAVSASRSFATELERLKGDHDPGWHRRTESGRLNVGRYVTGTDVDECFDEWQLGREDATDIEAVIILDTSGSMSWCLRSAFQSMWAIKRALDKVNASTTVVTFGSEAELLYSSNERATATMKYTGDGGGTEPRGAVDYAYSVLANSQRAVKLFIAITDGYWYDADQTDNKIRQLRKAGVITALAYVAQPREVENTEVVRIDSHGCEVATNITEARDLFTLARKMVKTGIARNLA